MIANWNKRKILLMCKFQFSEGLISNLTCKLGHQRQAKQNRNFTCQPTPMQRSIHWGIEHHIVTYQKLLKACERVAPVRAPYSSVQKATMAFALPRPMRVKLPNYPPPPASTIKVVTWSSSRRLLTLFAGLIPSNS